MEKNISKVVTIGTLVAITAFALQTQRGRIKGLYFKPEFAVSTNDVAQVQEPVESFTPETTPVVEGTQSANPQELKTLILTEAELNSSIKGSQSSLAQDTGENVKIAADLSPDSVNLVIDGGDSLSLNALLSVTADRKSLELVSYNLEGYDTYGEEVKKEVVNSFSGFVIQHIKGMLGGGSIEELSIDDSQIIVAYY